MEADDVNSSLEFIRGQPYADPDKVVVAGASLGGIVNIFAAAKSPSRYRAVVDQAGAWSQGYEPLVQELVRAGGSITIPILIQQGSQDQTAPPHVSRQVADELARLGKKVTFRLYPIGHTFNIFGANEVWMSDFLSFIEENLK